MRVRHCGRFILFAFGRYYPAGGWSDLVGIYDHVENAYAAANNNHGDYIFQIVDLDTAEIVEQWNPDRDSCGHVNCYGACVLDTAEAVENGQ